MSTAISNSRRLARLATYTPIRFAEDEEASGDLVTVAGLIRGLDIQPGELEALRTPGLMEHHQRALEAITELTRADSADRVFAATARLDGIPRSELVAVAESVREARAKALAAAMAALEAPASDPPPQGDPSATSLVPPWTQAASRWKRAVAADGAFDVASISTVLTWHPASSPLAPRLARAPSIAAPRNAPGSFRTSLIFRPGASLDFSKYLTFIQPYVPPGTDLATVDPIAALDELDRKTAGCAIVIDALARRNVQPLGLLHLESLEMTPVEVQRGELVYSLPLAPHEKVTLSHKEWAVRETEFSEFVQDSIENYSERGVVETDEMAIATQSETRKTERSGLGSSGGVVVTGPADATSTVVTNSQSQQESKRHAQTVTSQASSRSVRDHKVSFTVATVTGTEDFTSRLIENQSKRAMRIDYFRRMKGWRLNLYRTGVRLAYDIVIPDPGRRLRLRQELIKNYDRALAATFDPGLQPGDVDRDNFMDYAGAYGMALPAPPADPDTSSIYKQWQLTVFAALRDGAYAKFSQVKENIRQRRTELAREIDSGADAETLRRLEREEIQRLTLAWLVPGFPRNVSLPAAPTEPQGLTDASWQHALEFGEYIKFVHHAIDWSRLAYFLYPYYWSAQQLDRLFLRHPDAAHRDFLRAGAARVVVPIVPGLEEELTAFVDKGRIGKLPNGHRFTPVVAAVRKANQDFIGDDGNDGDAPTAAGSDVEIGRRLIGSWTEFTPTGALDLDVVTMPVNEL